MDTSSQVYYHWLGLISLTVLYNCIILPMRTAFTQFHELYPPVWMFIDYCIDSIYLLDIWVGCRTGTSTFLVLSQAFLPILHSPQHFGSWNASGTPYVPFCSLSTPKLFYEVYKLERSTQIQLLMLRNLKIPPISGGMEQRKQLPNS